jgi:hypothetical protein
VPSACVRPGRGIPDSRPLAFVQSDGNYRIRTREVLEAGFGRDLKSRTGTVVDLCDYWQNSFSAIWRATETSFNIILEARP